MSNRILIAQIVLQSDHVPTGRTRHYAGLTPVPPPKSLQIIRYPDSDDVYLVHLDSQGEGLTDTFHESLEDAMAQAQREFSVDAGEWVIIGS